ncbi:MAG: hypothetical protein NT061_11910 [Spirochaetes bacterium]|nr:hypothetical protein [Spirochaetota bacterium]
MKGRRGSGLVLVLAALVLAVSPAGAEEPKLTGDVIQSVSGSLDLSSGSIDAGTGTSLSLSFEAGDSSVETQAALSLSVLTGRQAELLWASLTTHPWRMAALLLFPAFDTSTDAPDILALAALENLSLRWSGGAFGAEAGFTTVNWGVGKAFSPADFFADIDYAEGKLRRLARLLGRLSWFPTATGRIDLVIDPSGPEGLTIASRAYGLAGDMIACGAALGLRFPSGSGPHFLGALDCSIDLPFASPYGEFFLRLPSDDQAYPTIQAMGGFSARVGDLTLMGEYLYSPDAAPFHSLFASASLPFDEWTSLAFSLSVLPEYGSGSGGIGLEISGPAGLSASISASGLRSAAGSWTLLASAAARLDF